MACGEKTAQVAASSESFGKANDIATKQQQKFDKTSVKSNFYDIVKVQVPSTASPLTNDPWDFTKK